MTSNADTHTVSFDDSATAGTVSIATVSGDDVINATEDNAATIAVSGTANGGDIEPGDTVTVTVNNVTYLTLQTTSVSYTVDVAASDQKADNSI